MYVYFQILRDLLGVGRGILLRYVAAVGQLLPYLSTGMNNTTLANLRLDLPSVQKAIGPEPITLMANVPGFIAPFLAFTDSNVDESVLLLALRTEDKLDGLLVLFDNPYATIPRAQIDLLFAPIRDTAARFLQEGFGDETLPSNHTTVLIRSISENSEIRSKIQAFHPGMAVSLDMSFLRNMLARDYPFLIAEAGARDILSVVHTACSDFPVISIRADDKLHLLLQNSMQIPQDVFTNALATNIALSFFGTTETVQSIENAISSTSVEEFLDHTFSHVSL